MKIKLTIIILLSLIIISCRTESKRVNSSQDSDVGTISILDTLSLKLNTNQKWIANIETHEGVKLMDSIISVFNEERTKDYIALGDLLSKQTSYIIKNCSMKGEPHDQLHVVLVPMLDEITILREQTNTIESKAALNRLEQLVAAYFDYFRV